MNRPIIPSTKTNPALFRIIINTFPIVFLFIFFYIYRAQHFSGDGALIARMTEGGKWLVKNELLSQALLQLVYQCASPFNLTAIEVMNILSCLCGVFAVWILLQFSRLYQIGATWPLLLFGSSAFFIYSCGHTEYYPVLLPAMFIYGLMAVLYLRDKCSVTGAALSFVIACGLHFGMLIAFPSLLLLPLLKKRPGDWGTIALWLVLIAPLVLIRNYPQMLGHKAAGLSPAWNFLPWFPGEGMYRHYAVFQWGHFADWLYAWSMRSWIFWIAIPMFFSSMIGQGICKDKCQNERRFLLIYTMCFTVWSFLWHPDLGIEADWDLFAIEAAPCLLLLITFIPIIKNRTVMSTMLAISCCASVMINYSHILSKTDFPHHGYGQVELQLKTPIKAEFTLDGYNRELSIPHISEGTYPAKLIDQTNRRVHEMNIVVVKNYSTRLIIE